MIYSATVINHLNEKLVLDFDDPDSSGFAVTNVSGLGPGSVNINMSELSSMDGSIYISGRKASRNIVFTLIFMDSPSIEENRHKSYRFFQLNKPITMIFETDQRTLKILGYVESNEPTIFSSMEGSQISVICPEPYFYDSNGNVEIWTNNYAVPCFRFPFINEYIERPTLKFSETFDEDGTFPYFYSGDVDTGFVMELELLSSNGFGDITIYNKTTGEELFIDSDVIQIITGRFFGNEDIITISTIPRKKNIYLSREGKKSNILSCVPIESKWPVLVPGENRIGYSSSLNKERIRMTLSHPILYQGV